MVRLLLAGIPNSSFKEMRMPEVLTRDLAMKSLEVADD
jgi:hypothetical protein